MKGLARIVALCAALGMAAPVWAEAPDTALRPATRPLPEAPLRPALRGGEALVTSAISTMSPAPRAVLPARQQARAEALTATLPVAMQTVAFRPARQITRAEALLAPTPAPLLVATVWTGVWPAPRPEGDFSAGADVVQAVFRPQSRPVGAPEQVVPVAAVVGAPVLVPTAPLVAMLRPALRPATEAPPQPVAAPEAEITPVALVTPAPVQLSPLAAPRAFRPALRPQQVVQRAETARATQQRGSVCGNAAIQGEVIAAINGAGGCGVADPVRVRSIGGITLSQPSVMDCRTATALNTWVERGARPAIGDLGGGISGLQVAGHYTCRPRNNQAGGRLSEHGKGRAIDISGIVLRNGTVISILNGWNSGSYGERLRAMHRAACGPFGTVLGPNANRFHADHFHFDTARYRSGSYCR